MSSNFSNICLFLIHKRVICTWYDRNIEPGQQWDQEIKTHLDTAHIILLLVSPDFIASKYCFGVEVVRAMERHASKKAVVIPVILRPVLDWIKTPFGNLQALPRDAKPVNTWDNRDEAYYSIAEGISNAVRTLINSRPSPFSSIYSPSVMPTATTPASESPKDAQNAQPFVKPSIIAENSAKNVQEWLEIGHKFYKYEQYSEALEAYDRAVYLDAKNAKIYVYQGNALTQLKRYDEALKSYQQSIHLQPENVVAHYNKGNILYHHLKNYEAALQAYKLCKNHGGIDVDFFSTGKKLSTRFLAYYSESCALYHLGQYDKVITIYERLPLIRGEISYSDALLIYDYFISWNPSDASAHYGKGYALYRLKRYMEAISAFEEAHLIDSDNCITYYCESKIRYDLKQYEEALAACDKFITLAPKHIGMYKSKGDILYDLKRYDEALIAYDHYDRFTEGRDSWDIPLKKSDIFYYQKRYDDALSIYDQLIAPKPSRSQPGSPLPPLGLFGLLGLLMMTGTPHFYTREKWQSFANSNVMMRLCLFMTS